MFTSNFIESNDIVFDINELSNLTDLLPVIHIGYMVSRARLRFKQDYLTVGISCSIKPLTMENRCHSTPKIHSYVVINSKTQLKIIKMGFTNGASKYVTVKHLFLAYRC